MSDQSTSAHASSHSKRQQLTAIVGRLGEAATPAQIREECYRVGFGAVNTAMLVVVRNSLWPNREKAKSGYTRELREKTQDLLHDLVPCPHCGSHRVRSHGGRFRQDGSYKRRRECHSCGRWFARVEDPKPLQPKQKSVIEAAMMTEKRCAYCNRTLPIDSFSLVAHGNPRRRSGCKECYARQWSARSQANKLASHGMTPDAYLVILEAQGGKCAICDSTDSGSKRARAMAIDHCHRTGRFRGLLCHKCNLGVGNFNDDPARLEAAASYIRRHSQPAF